MVIKCVANYGLCGYRINRDGYTGVWIDDRKVAAIGIKIRRWVTLHGLSVNVCPDMRYFENIVPCGITDKVVGSISQAVPHISVDSVARDLLEAFTEVFCVTIATHREGETASSYMEMLTSVE